VGIVPPLTQGGIDLHGADNPAKPFAGTGQRVEALARFGRPSAGSLHEMHGRGCPAPDAGAGPEVLAGDVTN